MESSHQDAFDVLLNAAPPGGARLGTVARVEKERSRDGGGADAVGLPGGEGSYSSEDKIMDSENKAVMMAWEGPLMEAHAKAVCGGGGGSRAERRVRDGACGYGHPEVLSGEAYHHRGAPGGLRQDAPGGMGGEGKCEDSVRSMAGCAPQLESYDGIFFDTYGEYYEDLREFHQHLPKLLKPGGIYSYFNGLCGDNAFFHVVYCQLVALELGNLGYTTQFIPLPVKDCLTEEVWKGVKQKYWQLDTYYLPVCQDDSDS